MTLLFNTRSGRLRRARTTLLVGSSVLVTACAGESMLAPPTGGTENVQLAASSRQLSSLGDTLRVDALVRNASGAELNAVPLRWQLSAPGVLEPLGHGLFRAVGNGRVIITVAVDPSHTGVRPGGYYADVRVDSVTVNVQQIPAQVLALSADTLFTMVGLTRKVHLRVTDARGHDIDRDLLRVSYHMVDARVATVDSTGRVTSAAEGRTELVATASTAGGASTWQQPVNVRPRAAHTSCMNFTQRRRAREACVTSNFIVHAPREITP